WGNGTVSEFAPGSTTPYATLTGPDRISHPSALAFDAHGNLYVANQYGDSVSVFARTPAAGGGVIRTAQPDPPLNIGTNPATGLALTNAELARIFATRTVTFGDANQTGNITFAAATTAITARAGVAAVQSPTGPGAIILDSTAGTALAAGSGN